MTDLFQPPEHATTRSPVPETDSPPREFTQIELILPEHSNHYGTLFAANGLGLLGKVAFLAGTRFARQALVMAGANRIEFLKPVPVGSLLRFVARVVRVGRSSMTVRVVAGIDGAPGQPSPDALRGEFELVAVDAQGRAVRIAATAPSDPSVARSAAGSDADPSND